MFYHCLGLLFVVSVSAIPLPEELDYDGKIPNCHDGGKPLLAADVGVHTCDKNCPKGFQCEYRTTDATLRKGICCPNLKELEKIYSEDEELDKNIKSYFDISTP
ncbi:Dynein heavy chain-like protein [Dirofilaria immitis]